MNMKTSIAGVFLVALAFISCKKELEPQESSETPLTEVAAPETPTMEKQFEVQNSNAQTVQMPNPAQSQVAPTAPGMNPAHGQPNHRCDIAVGAPLNSPKAITPPPAPVAQPAPQGQATINQVDMASGTTAVTTKPGMNPPHGEQGHKCEIAVGVPLPK